MSKTILAHRLIIPFILSAILLGACSRHRAFEHFQRLDDAQERAVTRLQPIALRDERNVTQVYVSVIYLNPVFAETPMETVQFLVAMLDRRIEPVSPYAFTLNGLPPLQVTSLEHNRTLRRLMPLDNAWNRYYALEFGKPVSEELNLSLEGVVVTYRP